MVAPKSISLQAQLIAEPAVGWLASRPKATILNVFDHSCNLIAQNGELLSLITPQVDPGPFSIVVDMPDGGNESFVELCTGERIGSGVITNAIGLEIGPLTVNVQTARCWDPRISPALLLQPPVDGIRLLSRLLIDYAPASSLASQVNGDIGKSFQNRIQAAWLKIERGISERSADHCAQGARLAAGVGVGLTPAGDDFLLGVIVALWSGLREPKGLVDSIVAEAAPRTSRLSAAWLRAAGRLEVGQAWHGLIGALHKNDKRSIVATGRRLLGIGHSSGRDGLTGFVAAVSILGRDNS